MAVVGEGNSGDDQVLTLRGFARDLRRSLRLIVVVGLVGLVGGALYAIAVPALPSASAFVLLPASTTNAEGQPLQDAETDIQIALSLPNLIKAEHDAGLALSIQTLQERVAVTTPATDILQITASGTTPGEAESLANAVMNEFLSYVNNSSLVAANVEAALQQQAIQVRSVLANLAKEIRSASNQEAQQVPGSPEAISFSNLIGVLSTERTNASLQLESVNSQIAEAEITASGPALGAVPLESATTAVRPSVARPFLLAILGALIGLVIAVLVALVRARLDSRLRSRDDIARAVGAPVLTSLSVKQPRRVTDWQHLLDVWKPTFATRAVLSALLEDLAIVSRGAPQAGRMHEPGRAMNGSGADVTPSILVMGVEVTVTVLAGDVCAQAISVELVASAAGLGIPVTFGVRSDRPPVDDLVTAIRLRNASPESQRENLLTPEGRLSPDPSERRLTVHLAVVDPGAAYEDDGSWHFAGDIPGESLLIVSAGYASAQQIAEAAEIAAQDHLRLVGVVVVNPDAGDMTTGRQRPAVAPLHRRVTAFEAQVR